MRSALIAIALATLASQASAVTVRDCDEAAHAQAIVEPWEKNAKTFYEGCVRVAHVDTGGEPVCCSAHLRILAPDESDEPGGRLCRVVGDGDALGFSSIDFMRLTAKYEPGKGLLLTFPYTRHVEDTRGEPGIARVRVNVAKGAVTVK